MELRCACDVSIWLITEMNGAHQGQFRPGRNDDPIRCDVLAYSSTIFFFARSRTSSSIVSLATNRYTLTCDFWPIRWARAIACRSFCGFQSLYRVAFRQHKRESMKRELTSKMMTVSAVSRLIPNPPARVERKNAKSNEPGALKCASSILCPPCIRPESEPGFRSNNPSLVCRDPTWNQPGERFSHLYHCENAGALIGHGDDAG